MPFHTLEFHWKKPFESRTVGYKSAEQTAGRTELEAYHFKSASGAVNLSFVNYPTGTTAEHAVDLDLTWRLDQADMSWTVIHNEKGCVDLDRGVWTTNRNGCFPWL